MIKWGGAILGLLIFKRLSGLFIGYFVGYLIEVYRQKGSSKRSKSATIDDFEFNLLILASLIIKANTNINKVELDYVRNYFVRSYGKEKANETFKVFNTINKKKAIDTKKAIDSITRKTSYESRLQIIHFLFTIAQADRSITEKQIAKIQEISRNFSIHTSDFISIKAMFIKENQHVNYFAILDIPPTASNDDIKKAYRKMVKKYHPDKLTHLPEHLKQGAKEKFLTVQKAYEALQKERGF